MKIILIVFILFNSLMAQLQHNTLLLSQLDEIKNGYDIVKYNDYLFISDEKNIISVDVSDSSSPFIVDTLFTEGNTKKLLLKNNTIFSLNSKYGVEIYEIQSDNQLALLNRLQLEEEARDLFIKNNYLYITEWVNYQNWTGSRIAIYNISDYNQIKFIGSIDKPTGMMYSLVSGNDSLLVVSEMYALNFFKYLPDGNLELIKVVDNGWGIIQIQIQENLLLVASNKFLLFDLADYNNIKELGYYSFFRSPHGLFCENNFVYIGCNYDYFRVLDITNPASPQQVGLNEKVQFSYNYDIYRNINIITENKISYVLDVNEGFYIVENTYSPTTSIQNELSKEVNYSLKQNYPNPFNPTTNIEYTVQSSEYVTLRVYDILGNEVATLVNEQKSAGSYEVKFDGSNHSSGVYFYRLESDSYNQIRKMILLR